MSLVPYVRVVRDISKRSLLLILLAASPILSCLFLLPYLTQPRQLMYSIVHPEYQSIKTYKAAVIALCIQRPCLVANVNQSEERKIRCKSVWVVLETMKSPSSVTEEAYVI